jgi:hypothetical protein
MQHMWLWGYALDSKVDPSVLMEHIATATSIYPAEELELFIKELFVDPDIRKTLCLDTIFLKHKNG